MENNQRAHQFSIRVKADKFEETNDIEYLIYSLQESYETGLPVDTRILKFLNNALQQWHQSNGTQSLDEIMRLKPGKGAKSVLLRKREKESKRKVCNDMALLLKLDFSLSEAAEIMSLYLQKEYESATPDKRIMIKPYKSGDKGDPEILFSPGTLMDYWRDHKDSHDEFNYHAEKILSSMSAEEIQRFKEQNQRLIFK